MSANLAKTIDEAFEKRDGITPKTRGPVRKAVEQALDLLDSGKMRVAEKQADGNWKVNQWLKKAVLLSFRLNDMSVIAGGPGKAAWWDKVPSKFDGWDAARAQFGATNAPAALAVIRKGAPSRAIGSSMYQKNMKLTKLQTTPSAKLPASVRTR